MKLLALLFALTLATVAHAQNITRAALIPLSNYVAMKLYSTNGLAWGSLTISNIGPLDDISFSQAISNQFGAISDSYSLGDNSANLFSSGYTWLDAVGRDDFTFLSGNFGAVVNYHNLDGSVIFYGPVNFNSGANVSGVFNVYGIAYDANGIRYANYIDASNNVRVAAGAGVVVTPSGAANQMTYTVAFLGGGGASNAVSFLTTNGIGVGTGLTGLGFTNSADILPSAYSNAQAGYIAFTLDPSVRLGFTGLVQSATSLLAYATQPSSPKLTNWSLYPTGIIYDATNRIDVQGTAGVTVTKTSSGGSNTFTIGPVIATVTTISSGASLTNPAFYLSGGTTTYPFRGKPTATFALVTLRQNVGDGSGSQLDTEDRWTFGDQANVPDFSINALSNTWVLNNRSGNSLGNASFPKYFYVIKDIGNIGIGYLMTSITNWAPTFLNGRLDGGSYPATNFTQLGYTMYSGAVKAPPAANPGSNVVVNFGATNKYFIYITNNITLTNLVGLAANKSFDATVMVQPQGANRSVFYPTLGGAQFGVRSYTNANSPMWTTLTNGSTYAISISAFDTNLFWAITEWK